VELMSAAGAALHRLLLPGLVYTGVVIGGGYATGRDLVQFFMRFNPASALLGIGAAALVWGIVLAVCFEFARATRSYDYRHLMRALLGRAWWLFEIPFFLMLVIGLAVMGAAAGEIVALMTGAPRLAGTTALLFGIGVLVAADARALERVLGWGSTLLFGFYLAFLWRTWDAHGTDWFAFAQYAAQPSVFASAGLYVAINTSMIPGILFCLRHLRSRTEAIGAGLVAGILVATPGFAFLLCMSAFYPEILDQPVPITHMLGRLAGPRFAVAFQWLLMFTLLQTGTGVLHAVNERIDGTLRERGRALPRAARAGIAMAYASVSIVLAERFGIVALIARGFTTLAWAFFVTFTLPLMTIGVYRLAIARGP
jgi:uncharacterized membrane protein YkvI